MIAAAAVGALVGSRLLGLAEQWPAVLAAARAGRLMTLLFSPGGKTIVGGLLGGWLAVELAKRLTGIRSRTGDLFVVSALRRHRRGAHRLLSGGTCGRHLRKAYPGPVGRGLRRSRAPRHPVQLYEIAFLMLLAVAASLPSGLRAGARFRIFLAGYLAWRIAIDFLKPQPLVLNMNLIQWACAARAVRAGRIGMVGSSFCSREKFLLMPRFLENVNFPKLVTVLSVTFGVALGACGAYVRGFQHSGG